MSFLDAYNYRLPKELIAHEPTTIRDEARLFVYDTTTDTVSFHHVADLPKILPDAHFMYNDTKVEPARLKGIGSGGQPIELLILVDQGFSSNREVRALVNRFTHIGEIITVSKHVFTVSENHEKSMLLEFSGNETELFTLLHNDGETPLPPYITSTQTEAVKRERYQSIFAATAASVAAPTASLHFTTELIQTLTATGATFSPVTLQVGLGTFAPVFPENFTTKSLHREFCSVPLHTAQSIQESKLKGKPVIAIGTTVVRTLETFHTKIAAGTGDFGMTDIFIFPPYHFHIPDVLLTNFHVPKSSLMCLVEAFLQDKGAKRSLVELYTIAIAEKFRFYSYGDAMLIL